MSTLAITAFGYVDAMGAGGTALDGGGLAAASPLELRWSDVSSAALDRFGRMDGLCKCAMMAVELLGLRPSNSARDRWAVVLGTEFGSAEVDRAFIRTIGRPGGASPALFTYTLASAAIGEIAIRHRITGPDACFVAGPQSGLLALWEGARLVESGEAAACVAVGCDAVSAQIAGEAAAFGYAFLVEDAGAAAPGGRSPLAALSIKACGATAGERLTGRAALAAVARSVEGGEARGDMLVIAAPEALATGQVMEVQPTRRSRGRTCRET